MELPPIGLGTMGVDDPSTITTALDVGYRHLDTAQIYDTEGVIGDGLAASTVDREALIVATKVWADSLAPDDVSETTQASLHRLGLERVDLLYVHRPIDSYDPERTLAAFDQLYSDRIIGGIGLSNFTIDQLETARNLLSAPIAAHQVEFHPLWWSEALLTHAQTHDYQVVAYSPLAGGTVNEIEAVVDIATTHDTTPETVAIAWLLSKPNVVTIPKASSRRHLEANLAARQLTLTDDECRRIDDIDRTLELYPE
ncbi:aldo/keto reductase [Halohasta litorea]|uniref:Aldo/keto reductase n=1 Tax=Halohasta litorea TaxID=869891 RepID=A0ABD6DA61_9EURY|nr:aldo/keto reductase [Halohasta litorea]